MRRHGRLRPHHHPGMPAVGFVAEAAARRGGVHRGAVEDQSDGFRATRERTADVMYWASGCLHGPHHIMKQWADRYAA